MTQISIGSSGATPEQEDRALFRTYGGPIEVDLIPQVDRPGRFLFLARAFFQKDTEIVAVFSGRRALETEALRRALSDLENRARQQAVARRSAPPNARDIRLPVKIKGSWHHSFYSDDDGQEVKSFQLIVARWSFTDLRGQTHHCGESPAFDVAARRRNVSHILQKREIDAVPRDSRLWQSPQ